MAARKFVTVPRKDKKEQLTKHLFILNKAFAEWFKKLQQKIFMVIIRMDFKIMWIMSRLWKIGIYENMVKC